MHCACEGRLECLSVWQVCFLECPKSLTLLRHEQTSTLVILACNADTHTMPRFAARCVVQMAVLENAVHKFLVDSGQSYATSIFMRA